MTKTPQQIKNEVEKEIKEAEDKIHENAKDDKHYSAWVHSAMIKIISEGKVKLSILTEYDKSIKEMIEEEFNEFVGTQSGSIKNFNVYVCKNAILYKLEDDEVGK